MTASTSKPRKIYTADEVWQFALQDQHFELIDGELFPMAPSNLRHGRIAGRIAIKIGAYALERQLGEVYVAEPGFLLPNGSILVPDVAFVATAHLPPENDTPGFDQAIPDLAVEVVSDSNTKVEMHQKVQLFFGNGSRQVWVVYPRSKTVYVYSAPDKVLILQGDSVIDVGDVLPGFTLPLREIFGRLDKPQDED
jgi:Uma2 family endonuclease